MENGHNPSNKSCGSPITYCSCRTEHKTVEIPVFQPSMNNKDFEVWISPPPPDEWEDTEETKRLPRWEK